MISPPLVSVTTQIELFLSANFTTVFFSCKNIGKKSSGNATFSSTSPRDKQWKPDFSNLQGKCNLVREIGSKITVFNYELSGDKL